MSRVFVSWSGGKDCCLACYRAIKDGLKIEYLANTVTEDGRRSCSHGISALLIEMQSRAMGIKLVQQRTGPDNYEAEFKKMLRELKREGISGGVFGDIDFEPHREWIERVCKEADITPHLPLWKESQAGLLAEFIELGFEAVVIATSADLMGEGWLGRRIDLNFIQDLENAGKTKPITPCGEAGEYHTLVIDGPLFRQRLDIISTDKVLRDGHWFLEIADKLEGQVKD